MRDMWVMLVLLNAFAGDPPQAEGQYAELPTPSFVGLWNPPAVWVAPRHFVDQDGTPIPWSALKFAARQDPHGEKLVRRMQNPTAHGAAISTAVVSLSGAFVTGFFHAMAHHGVQQEEFHRYVPSDVMIGIGVGGIVWEIGNLFGHASQRRGIRLAANRVVSGRP